jgi:hypothetical protein
MNATLQFTLLAEGSSDAALIPILRWLLAQHRASGLHGRRLKKFPTHQARTTIAEFLDDPSILRRLSAFQKLKDRIATFAKSLTQA